MLIKVLGVRKSAIGVKASLRVWFPSFITPVACSASLLPPGAVFSLVSVSVPRLFYGVGSLAPHPTLLSLAGDSQRAFPVRVYSNSLNLKMLLYFLQMYINPQGWYTGNELIKNNIGAAYFNMP